MMRPTCEDETVMRARPAGSQHGTYRDQTHLRRLSSREQRISVGLQRLLGQCLSHHGTPLLMSLCLHQRKMLLPAHVTNVPFLDRGTAYSLTSSLCIGSPVLRLLLALRGGNRVSRSPSRRDKS